MLVVALPSLTGNVATEAMLAVVCCHCRVMLMIAMALLSLDGDVAVVVTLVVA
jgi:hypothetical protein